MKETDGILALLQDIKDILYGIALLLLGGILCVAGILLDGLFLVLPAAGVFILLAGALNVHYGHRHHEVVEKED